MKLWDKGFNIDAKIENFTVGEDRNLDIHLAYYDLKASEAHATMLQSIGMITASELSQINEVFKKMYSQIKDNSFVIETSFEDVHSKIEFELIKSIGETGKKIHLARSRNDQVITALHLFFKDGIQIITSQISNLFNVLIELAENHKNVLMPGYTHTQIAMPSSFGMWFGAYAELLIDDLYQLHSTLKIVNQNPLGSAAGYGSSIPIDRQMTTELMGFKDLKYNMIAAQMSRGRSEKSMANSMGQIASTISKLSDDICLYMSQNFGFLTFPNELTTGSSIMPHKKNPDVFELLRAECNIIQALPQILNNILLNQTTGYHRDFQLLKKHTFNHFFSLVDCLDICSYSMSKININKNILDNPIYDHIYTVENVNELVKNGKSFRDAYIEVGLEVEKGTYSPNKNFEHSLIGGIHNPAFEKIKSKFANALSNMN